MSKKEILIITDVPDSVILSLPELCETCGLTIESINELIEYEIIQPIGAAPDQWTFDVMQLHRVKRALRLQHDLEMNLASIALVLGLLDELEQLRERTALLEKHLLK